MNPYVFVVGCPRSGTTLLQRMLDAHPQLAIPRETHWIPQLAGLPVGPELLRALVAHPKFRNLRLEPAELEPLAHGTFAEFVTAVFDLYGARRGKPLVGDKTPGYVHHMPLLHGLWSEARFVHLVRDGRDVCLSALNWTRKVEQFRRRFPTWDDDPVTTAALWWRWHVSAGRAAGVRLGPALYREVRYEALVADPERESAALCVFLGLEYDDAVVRFHEGRTRTGPGISAKHAWLPPTPGLRDWRAQLPRDALERVEAAAGDLLEEVGYERGVPRPGAERLAHAQRVAAAFTEKRPERTIPVRAR